MRVPGWMSESWTLFRQFVSTAVGVAIVCVLVFIASRVGGPSMVPPVTVNVAFPEFVLPTDIPTDTTWSWAIRYGTALWSWLGRTLLPHKGFWTVLAILILLLTLLKERMQRMRGVSR